MKTVRTVSILIVLLGFAVQGFRIQALPESQADDLLAVVTSLGIAVVCVVDSQVRKRPIPKFSTWLLVLFAPIAAPIYLLWSRGWWGLFVLGVSVVVGFGTLLLGALVAWLTVGTVP